jgi:hypothetical protein
MHERDAIIIQRQCIQRQFREDVLIELSDEIMIELHVVQVD